MDAHGCGNSETKEGACSAWGRCDWRVVVLFEVLLATVWPRVRRKGTLEGTQGIAEGCKICRREGMSERQEGRTGQRKSLIMEPSVQSVSHSLHKLP